jgi:hypothetical protein
VLGLAAIDHHLTRARSIGRQGSLIGLLATGGVLICCQRRGLTAVELSDRASVPRSTPSGAAIRPNCGINRARRLDPRDESRYRATRKIKYSRVFADLGGERGTHR